MLKLFRKKIVMKIILWGLLVLILPAFVMWGSANISKSKEKGPSYVGFLNNRKVTFDELYQALSGVRSQIILHYFNQPKALEALLTNRPLLAKLAWDRLIMIDEAKKLKLKAPDKEVIETIRTHPLFMRNGAFDDKFYSYILHNSIGLEPRAFEETVRENISIQKLGAELTKDVKITDEEIADEYKKEFGKVRLAYILIEPQKFFDKVKIEEAAVKDFYDKHKGELLIKSNLKGALPDRLATYEESKTTIERRLKELEAGKLLPGEGAEIYNRLIDLVEKKGETFGKAAADLGFEVKDTGSVSRADNIEGLGEAAVLVGAAGNLKDLELSKPVETNKGFVIFEVTERSGIIDEEKFKKEKEEYAKKVREEKSNIMMEEWLRKLEGQARLEIKLEEIEKYYR